MQGLAIIGGTFILEDGATVATAMGVSDGKLEWPTGILSLYLGIVLGDLGLYGLGRLASFVPWVKRRIPPQRQFRGRDWLENHVFKVVFIARFLPGVRLPTYTTCGYLNADFKRFAMAAIGATLIWTTMLFLLSIRIGKVLMAHLGVWRWAGAAGLVLAIVLAGRLAASATKSATTSGSQS